MKKLYFFLTALLVAMAANAADWYLVGSSLNGASVWVDNATYKMTPDPDDANIYTYDIAILKGEIKIKEAGTWNTSFSTNGSKLKEGVLYTGMRRDSGNISIDGTIEDAHIVLNVKEETLLITGKATANDYTCVYLVGNLGSGWDENITTYPLNLKEGTTNVYEGKYTLTAATSYFKLKAGSLVYGTGGNDIAIVPGQEYTGKQSGNAFSIPKGEYTFTYVLDKNADEGKLTVKGTEVEITSMYVLGEVNGKGWASDNGVEMTSLGNGVFEAKNVSVAGIGNGYFSFTTVLGATWDELNANATRYGATEKDFAPSFTAANTLVIAGDPNAFKVPNGEYDMTVNIKDMTLLITKTDGPVVYPSTLYVIGNVNGGTWAPDNVFAMTAADEDGVFTATVAIGGEMGTEFGYFSFCENAGASADADQWNALGMRYGAETEDAEPSFTEANKIVAAGSPYSFKVAEGTYLMTVNLAEGTLTIATEEIPELDVPEALYIIGNVEGYGWATDKGVEMTKDGKTFTAQVNIDDNPDAEGLEGYFSFVTTLGADWDAVNSSDRYGAAIDNQNLGLYTPEEDAPAVAAANNAGFELKRYMVNVDASSAKSFAAYPGLYKLTADFSGEMPMLYAELVTVGVSAVEADSDEAVEYYNLQGIRVTNPENGIFIRRQGAKVSKVTL